MPYPKTLIFQNLMKLFLHLYMNIYLLIYLDQHNLNQISKFMMKHLYILYMCPLIILNFLFLY